MRSNLEVSNINAVVRPNEFQAYETNSNVSRTLYLETKELTLKPSCRGILFMLPYPFLCLGCTPCVSITAKLSFSLQTRILNVTAYPGFLKCCSKSYDLPISEVKVSKEIISRCCHPPAFRLRLETNEESIAITGEKNVIVK
jgi:hypothetical protein